jgi:hypothetical protein
LKESKEWIKQALQAYGSIRIAAKEDIPIWD